MKKALLWTTVISGAVALYLMLKRGEPFGDAATEALEHPFGSLLNELKRG